MYIPNGATQQLKCAESVLVSVIYTFHVNYGVLSHSLRTLSVLHLACYVRYIFTQEERKRKESRAGKVGVLLQLDMESVKEHDLRNIMDGLDIDTKGARSVSELKKRLIKNVPELKSEMESK